jgi:hypothetical protein
MDTNVRVGIFSLFTGLFAGSLSPAVHLIDHLLNDHFLDVDIIAQLADEGKRM